MHSDEAIAAIAATSAIGGLPASRTAKVEIDRDNAHTDGRSPSDRQNHTLPADRRSAARKNSSGSRCDAGALSIMALLLGFWHLDRNGFGNTYYAAAIRVGSHGLRNLFFGSFDPLGVMAVDKPPAGLILPAAAAHLFGFSSWTVLGPQAVLFAAGAALLVVTTGAWFGRRAGQLVGLAFVLTPIEVAVARSDNPDALLVLATTVSLLATLAAIRTNALRWVVVASLAVGVGFTTKQVQALVGVPGLIVALLMVPRATLHRRLAMAAVFSIVAFGSSAAWMLAVDRTDPTDRPYIAGSRNNTEADLAFGLNGSQRLAQSGHSAARKRIATANQATYGAPDPTRLLNVRNVVEADWFLPAALLGGGLAVVLLRGKRRLLASVWVWTFGQAAILTFTPGKFSTYYIAPLIPGVAILFGVALDAALPRIKFRLAQFGDGAPDKETRPHTRALLLLVLGSVVGGVLLGTRAYGWIGPIAVTVGAALVLTALRSSHPTWQVTITALATLMSVFAGPARWSVAAITNPQLPVDPAAEIHAAPRLGHRDQTLADQSTRISLFARTHRKGETFELATNKIWLAASEIVDGSAPVAELGGFTGWDAHPALPTLQRWVTSGKLRFLVLPDLPPKSLTALSVPPWIAAKPWAPWVRKHCVAVPPVSYGGIDTRSYWLSYAHTKPLRSPLVLFDCAAQK